MNNICVMLLFFLGYVTISFQSEECDRAKVKASRIQSMIACPLPSTPCTRMHDAVCGFNPCKTNPKTQFKTFENICLLRGSVCNGPGHWYNFVYNGTCPNVSDPKQYGSNV